MVFTPLTKKFKIAVPPPIKIDKMAVVDLKTRLKLPLKMVQIESRIEKIEPMFSLP
jgi:hypothetical protein